MIIHEFQNISFCKYVVLTLQLSFLTLTAISPLLFMDKYFQIFVLIQKIYLLLSVFGLIMIINGAYQGFRILKRIEKNEPICLKNERNIYHAIALPIYQEQVQILRQTLNRLSKHSKAKTNYLIFLAMEQNSNKPQERAEKLKKQFCNSFKQFSYTFHQLQEGEGRGKASNLTWCLKRMEPVFIENQINIDDVLFTTIDCDNWVPNAYFEEVELFLSKNQWKMNKYMFAPNQMVSINVNEVSLYNRVLDFMLGLIVFLWSNTISKVQNAASNYSISYTSLKQIGYLDTNPDSMCDDYHTSLKFLWKKQETVQIIPIFVMFNMMSLKTGNGIWQDIKARFWQSERHTRSILDIAYNLKQIIKNPFKFKAVWGSINFLTNHFFSTLSFNALIFYTVIKIASGQSPFNDELFFIVNTTSLITSSFIVIYYILINKSAKVLYGKKEGISWMRCLQALLFYPVAVFTFLITQVIASVRVTVKTPQFDAAPKQGTRTTIN